LFANGKNGLVPNAKPLCADHASAIPMAMRPVKCNKNESSAHKQTVKTMKTMKTTTNSFLASFSRGILLGKYLPVQSNLK